MDHNEYVNTQYNDNYISSIDENLNKIKNNIPDGLTKLCGNVQTILIATMVPSTISVVISIIKDQNENFISMILIFTLIIISIGLLFYSLYVYLYSERSINSYFVGLFTLYICIGLYILYNFYINTNVYNLFIKTSYADTYSDLLRIILSFITVSTLLFAFVNINYGLYNSNN
jgi:hypothetical protein